MGPSLVSIILELRHDILSFFFQRANFPFSVNETTNYLFGKREKHQNGKNKPKLKGTRMVKDGED